MLGLRKKNNNNGEVHSILNNKNDQGVNQYEF